MAAPGMVIVGAGECGARAALSLREAGYSGAVTMVGAERHLAYERPPLSKETMLAAEELPPKTVASAERLVVADITAILGNAAVRIDRERHAVTSPARSY